MSYQLMSWAATQTTGSPTRKAVLLALANRANHDTGQCNPSIRRICEETEFGATAVKSALFDLADAGLIVRRRRRRADGSLGTYTYTFPSVVPADDVEPEPGDGPPEPGADPRPEPGADSLNQEVLNQEGSSTANAVDSLREEGIYDGGKRWAVDRKPVSIAEGRLAADVMRAWNELTGQELRAKSWLAKIVMRIREYPEATLDDHRYLIERNLANPWWSGPPTPSVIYGSDAQFERSVMYARHHEDEPDRIERIVNAVMERSRT